MRLTGDLAEYYDILYSALQNDAWTDWAKNGEEVGQGGVGLWVDGIRVSVVRKDQEGVSYAGEIDPSKPMVALTYDGFNLTGGNYYFDTALFDRTATVNFDYKSQIKKFFVLMDYIAEGVVVLNHHWRHTCAADAPAWRAE